MRLRNSVFKIPELASLTLVSAPTANFFFTPNIRPDLDKIFERFHRVDVSFRVVFGRIFPSLTVSRRPLIAAARKGLELDFR